MNGMTMDNEGRKRPRRIALGLDYEKKCKRVEPLRENLHPYVEETRFGLFIRHPFCNAHIHDMNRCALIHEQIDRRSAEADAYFEAADYERYLGCIEVPHQPEYLAKDAWLFSDAQYWRLLGTAYSNQKHTIQYRELFDELFRADRPGREHLMDEDERRILERLPDEIAVYRGYSDDEYETLQKEQAIWYAHLDRSDDPNEIPRVIYGKIKKQDVWAYLAGGEVLLPPEAVRRPRVKDVSRETQARVAWAEYVPGFDVNRYLGKR